MEILKIMEGQLVDVEYMDTGERVLCKIISDFTDYYQVSQLVRATRDGHKLFKFSNKYIMIHKHEVSNFYGTADLRDTGLYSSAQHPEPDDFSDIRMYEYTAESVSSSSDSDDTIDTEDFEIFLRDLEDGGYSSVSDMSI